MRKWIDLFESNSLSHEIKITDGSSLVFGEVLGTTGDQLEEWLEDTGADYHSLLRRVRSDHSVVAVLYKILVDESERGQGKGGRLLESFMNEAKAHGATAIILEANTGERQLDGFDLVSWYEDYQFYTEIERTDPIMMRTKGLL